MRAFAGGARDAQPIAQLRELGDHVVARIGRGEAAHRLHHRDERVDGAARGGHARLGEFGRHFHRFLQPELQRVRDIGQRFERRGARGRRERVRGTHEIEPDRMHAIGFDRRHLAVEGRGVLLGLADVDREERARDDRRADSDVFFLAWLLHRSRNELLEEIHFRRRRFRRLFDRRLWHMSAGETEFPDSPQAYAKRGDNSCWSIVDPGGAFFAWTRGRYYFSAHAKGGERALEEFVKGFPY